VPVWSLQDGDLRPDALEPDDAVHPIALDRRLSLQLESELNQGLPGSIYAVRVPARRQ
jgi:hypothetical protein